MRARRVGIPRRWLLLCIVGAAAALGPGAARALAAPVFQVTPETTRTPANLVLTGHDIPTDDPDCEIAGIFCHHWPSSVTVSVGLDYTSPPPAPPTNGAAPCTDKIDTSFHAATPGRFECSFSIPAVLANGPYTLNVTVWKSVLQDDGSYRDFIMESGLASYIVANPELEIIPRGGGGTMSALAFHGRNFDPGGVTPILDGHGAQITALCTADVNGLFTCDMTPQSFTAGPHTFTAHTNTLDVSRTLTFGALSARTSNGVTVVAGSGFGSGRPISVAVDAAAAPTAGPCVTGPDGSFSCRLQGSVPSGPHLVAARTGTGAVGDPIRDDEVYGVTTLFTSTLNPVPLSAHPWDDVLLGGFNLPPNKSALVYVNGRQPFLPAVCITTAGGILERQPQFPGDTGQPCHVTLDQETAAPAVEVTLVDAFTQEQYGQTLVFIRAKFWDATPAVTRGGLLHVRATGMLANTSMPVTVDGASIGACNTSALGTLDCDLPVPPSLPSGAHVVGVPDTAVGLGPELTKTFRLVSLAASPTTVAPGGVVRLVGEGFTPGRPVFAHFMTGPALNGACATNGVGAFDCTLGIPLGVTGGTLLVQTADESATTTLAIAATLGVAPASGKVGTSLAITAAGVSANFVEVRLDNARIGNCSAFNGGIGGLFSPPCSVAVPPATAGMHTLALYDPFSPFTPLVTRPFEVTRFVSFSTTTGTPGSTVGVTGTGFAASEELDVSVGGTFVRSCNADNAGTADCTFAASTFAGMRTIEVAGGGQTWTSPLTLPPLVSVTPSAAVGETATLTGAGFASSGSVSVRLDGSLVTTCPTDAGGTTSCSFAVPETGAGAHTVDAADGAGGAAQATLAVTRSLGLQPASGLAGTSTTVAGRGFAASAPIALTGATSGSTCTANAVGSFSCPATVPMGAATGALTVGANDGAGSATAAFTVLAAPAPTPSDSGGGSTPATPTSPATPTPPDTPVTPVTPTPVPPATPRTIDVAPRGSLRRRHSGRLTILDASVRLDGRASVVVTLVGPQGRTVELQAGSAVGARVASAAALQLGATVPAGNLRLALRVRTDALRDGVRYRVLVRAVTPAGQRDVLAFSFVEH